MAAKSRVQPGRIKQVTALSNPIIKSIKALNLKKNRDAESVFLAEGLKLITDAVEGGWRLKTLIFATSFSGNDQLQQIAATARNRGCDILEVSEKVLASITRRDNPQMVVGVVEQEWHSPGDVFNANSGIWIALDRVRDPGNLGTIVRTADALGVEGVLLIDQTTDPYSMEAVRATMGSIFHIKLSRTDETGFKEICKAWQGQVVGTHLSAKQDFRQITYHQDAVILLMGNEQQGLPESLVSLCDDLAYIPMVGKADSLNLAISTGIMLYEIQREKLIMEQH